jgi:hypothetical protein
MHIGDDGILRESSGVRNPVALFHSPSAARSAVQRTARYCLRENLQNWRTDLFTLKRCRLTETPNAARQK